MRYILKRLLFLVPTLLLLVVAGFILIESAPQNPELLNMEIETNPLSNPAQQEAQKRQLRSKYGLDLPVFYFRITHLADIDTLNRIASDSDRQLIQQLLIRNGNSNAVMHYYQSLKEWITYSRTHIQNNADSVQMEFYREILAIAYGLLNTWNTDAIKAQVKRAESNYDFMPIDPKMKEHFSVYKSAFESLNEHAQPWKTWIPSLRFYTKNRFHQWLFGNGSERKGIIRGDFGVSWYNQRPVLPYLLPKLFWSVLLTFLSVLMAYVAAIPIGLLAARNVNRLFDRVLQAVILILFSIPSFLAAILLLRTFSNPDVFQWFPTGGVAPTGGFQSSLNFLQQIIQTIPYLVLPVIAYTYGSFVFLTRLTREQLVQEQSKPYAITARSKGITQPLIFRRHLLRNSLLPLITVFSQVFPASVAGSVVIESIFTIPGMGQETLLAVFQMNYPVLAAILVISGLFTIIGYLISDILYVLADPRIRLNKNNRIET